MECFQIFYIRQELFKRELILSILFNHFISCYIDGFSILFAYVATIVEVNNQNTSY